eukprot:m.161198 g.161198  ORF g.161198 m.161198 type:complete len:502 (+) comp38804_c0_seq7:1545-3050(+)
MSSCKRLRKSETECLLSGLREVNLEDISQVAGVHYDSSQLRAGFIDLAYRNLDAEDNFWQSLNTFFDKKIRITKEKPLGSNLNQMRFLEMCRKNELDLLKAGNSVKIIFLKKDEEQPKVILKGPRGLVLKADQQIDELLEDFNEETFTVVYPARAYNGVKARFYTIRDDLKETADMFVDIKPPSNLLQLSKDDKATCFVLAGVQKAALDEAKERFEAVPKLLRNFSKSVVVPVRLCKKLQDREQRIELGAALPVGLDVRKDQVYVYATSVEDFEMAENVLKTMGEEQESFSQLYDCKDEPVMRIFCTKRWKDVARCGKAIGTFLLRGRENSSLTIKGSRSKIAETVAKLDSMVSEVKQFIVEEYLQLTAQQAALVSNPGINAKIRKIENDFGVVICKSSHSTAAFASSFNAMQPAFLQPTRAASQEAMIVRITGQSNDAMQAKLRFTQLLSNSMGRKSIQIPKEAAKAVLDRMRQAAEERGISLTASSPTSNPMIEIMRST